MRRRARSLPLRLVVVYDGACWKGQMVATVSPSAQKGDKKPKKGQELVRIPSQ